MNNNNAQISYLLSFLAILVHRAGGTLVIENLNEYASSDLQLSMKLDAENNKVTLITTKEKRDAKNYNRTRSIMS